MFQHPEQMVWELGRRMAPEYAQGFNLFIFSKPSPFPLFQNETLQRPWFCRDWVGGGKGDSWIWPQGLTSLILSKPGVKCQNSLAPKSLTPNQFADGVSKPKTVWHPSFDYQNGLASKRWQNGVKSLVTKCFDFWTTAPNLWFLQEYGFRYISTKPFWKANNLGVKPFSMLNLQQQTGLESSAKPFWKSNHLGGQNLGVNPESKTSVPNCFDI